MELDLVDPLAAALDSLAELVPMLEAEKSVGLLPYYPVAEAVGEVAAPDEVAVEVATEPVASVEVEAVARGEAESVAIRKVGREDSAVELSSRERETILWGDVARSIDALAAAEDGETAADGDADCSSVAAELDVITGSATECVAENPAVADDAVAVAESKMCEEAAECDLVVDEAESSAEECCVVEEPTEIDAVEGVGGDDLYRVR